MKTLLFIVSVIFLSAWTNVLTETRTITGYVYENTHATPLEGVLVSAKATSISTATDKSGFYTLKVPVTVVKLVFDLEGYIRKEIKIGTSNRIDAYLIPDKKELKQDITRSEKIKGAKLLMPAAMEEAADYYINGSGAAIDHYPQEEFNTEEYSTIHENIFHSPVNNPLSTFSIESGFGNVADLF